MSDAIMDNKAIELNLNYEAPTDELISYLIQYCPFFMS